MPPTFPTSKYWDYSCVLLCQVDITFIFCYDFVMIYILTI